MYRIVHLVGALLSRTVSYRKNYIVAALGIAQIKILAFLFVGSKMMCLLDASKVDDALALVTDLSDNLEDRTLEVRLHKGSSVSWQTIAGAAETDTYSTREGRGRVYSKDARMGKGVHMRYSYNYIDDYQK